MQLFRIVQDAIRTKDLSGTGAFRYGGRWNSKGTYMLYTSENSSLAYLESLVHFDPILLPPKLFIVQLELNDSASLYTVPESEYNPDWKKLSLLKNQQAGDKWMSDKKYIAVKVRSAINKLEYNYLLNPLFAKFHDLVQLISTTEIEVDKRLV